MHKPMMILNLDGGLPERGHIKIGGKGEARQSKSGGTYQLPVKHDHFTITTMTRGPDGNFLPDVELMETVAQSTSEPAGNLRRIPVRLLWDDLSLNLATRYAAYEKPGKQFCSGNGADASELQHDGSYAARSCPCNRIEQGFKPSLGNPRCKLNGILTVDIVGAPSIGGVWKFRTTSWNTVRALSGQLAYYRTLTGGPLEGLPLILTISPKQVTAEDKQQTIYMVGLDFPGTADKLRDAGYQVALRRKQAEIRMSDVEEIARRMLALPGITQGFPGETDDSLAEFYPHVRQDKPAVAENQRMDAPAHVAEDSETPAQGSEAAGPQYDPWAPETWPADDYVKLPAFTQEIMDSESPPELCTPEQLTELRSLVSPAFIKKFCDSFGATDISQAFAIQIQVLIHNARMKREQRQ